VRRQRHRRPHRDLFWLFLGMLCFGAGPAGAAEDGFRVAASPLHLDGEVSCVLSTGLEGGRAGELAVGFVEDAGAGRPRKVLALFRPGPGNRYGPEPAAVFPLPDDAGVVDFADIDRDGRTDLVATRRGALWAYLRNGDGTLNPQPRALLRWPSNLPFSREQVFSLPLFRDADRDGRPDVLLPTQNGYDLFCQAEDGSYPERPDASFPLDYGASLQTLFQGNSLWIHYYVPRPRALDVDRDGVQDLVFADGDTLSFFPFDPGTGAYGPKKTVRLPVRKEGNQFVVSKVDDFDADGFPDALVMRGVQRKVTYTVDSLFYRGGPGLAFRPREELSFHQDRQIIPPWILDLTGDGRKEFVTFTQRLSLNSVVDYFVRNRVTVDVSVHANRDGDFGTEPVLVRKVSLKLEEEEGSPGAVDGDFNGDGRDDLVYTPDSGRLHYMLAGGEEMLPGKPSLDLEVPSYGRLVVEDFNGDGRDDLAVIYEVEKRKGDLTVLVSGAP